MKKFYHFILLFSFIAGFLCSCNDDDDKFTPTLPEISIESTDGFFAMPQEDTLVFKAKLTDPSETNLSWTINGKEVSNDSIFHFTTDAIGNYELKLTATNTAGKTSTNKSIKIYEKYKHGTFILNEGLIGTHGSLIYISPRGKVTDSVYYRENGTFLNDLTQDLFIYNNKMYIIAQRNDDHKDYGSITILNAETMKLESHYNFPRRTFTQSTHIAVLGEDDIYIRDATSLNTGKISVYHPSDNSVKAISGTEGALHNTMAIVNGKVFAIHTTAKQIMVLEKGKTEVSATISFDGLVSGVIKSSDGKLWVSDETGKISKVDPDTYEIISSNQLTGQAAERLKRNPVSSKAAAPHITAKGDTLYMSGTTTLIYRHIFSQNETKLMVDAQDYIPVSPDYWEGNWVHPFVYNTCAVHPITGEVFINTLKGIGNDRYDNHITVFDFNGSNPRVSTDYANFLDYPANIYFTRNFE